MDTPEIIDAEFTVIPPTRDVVVWKDQEDLMAGTVQIKAPPMTFWADDFPKLFGYAFAGVAVIFIRYWLHR